MLEKSPSITWGPGLVLIWMTLMIQYQLAAGTPWQLLASDRSGRRTMMEAAKQKLFIHHFCTRQPLL